MLPKAKCELTLLSFFPSILFINKINLLAHVLSHSMGDMVKHSRKSQ